MSAIQIMNEDPSHRQQPAAALLALTLGRRGVEVGAGVEASDQGQMSAVAMGETGQVVRGIAAVAQQDELSCGKPADERCDPSLGQVDEGAVAAAILLVQFLRFVQGRQHKQGPETVGEGESDVDGQHDPLVAPLSDDVAVGGADGVVVAAFAIDLFALVQGGGVVDAEDHGLIVGDPFEDDGRQHTPQDPR